MSSSGKYKESRREFLKKTASVGLGLYGMMQLGIDFPNVDAADVESKVVIAQDDKVIDKQNTVVESIVQKLLDNALMNLAGVKNRKAAWSRYFNKKDVVGIKVNTLAGRHMTSHVQLVKAIINSLKSISIPEENIIIWDKADNDLTGAGYEINISRKGVKCLSTESTVGYTDLIMYGSIASCYSRILSNCTALVNVPVLKHHSMAGVTISLKNWLGAVHNPNKYHFDAAADPYIADINMPDILRKRRQLIVCDALVAQCNGGPGFNPNYTWNCNSLLVATDPVALDSVGTRMIEVKRKEMKLSSLKDAGIEPKYIAIAADKEHRLGMNDLKKIQLVKV
ncbi:TPA: DUF362 domain-containing protein [Candidatus Poribacteria bacterium]|nr:DUF362 domain-containing protein [Candidatus Poribacteria bacterium]